MQEQEAPSTEFLKGQIKQQLETDPELKRWFEKFNKFSWDYFMDHYAGTKHRAFRFPELYLDEFKPMNKEFNELARQSLEYIQQVKLFHLQCQWRAGKIELPFVQICYDFELFGDHIMECPFLPPISLEEVELYCRFLETSDSDEFETYNYKEWQNYKAMKKEVGSDETGATPAWYEYYDTFNGTGFMVTLPDMVGEKEKQYTSISYKEAQRHRPPYVPNPEFQKPSPNYESDLIDFARRFEEPKMSEIIISHIKTENHHNDFEFIDRNYEYLKKITEPIVFEPSHDWKESLLMTVIRYKKRKIIEALPRVWRQYHKDVGNDHEAYLHRRIANADKDLIKILDSDGVRAAHAKWILEGRKLLGEPENFDY